MLPLHQPFAVLLARPLLAACHMERLDAMHTLCRAAHLPGCDSVLSLASLNCTGA